VYPEFGCFNNSISDRQKVSHQRIVIRKKKNSIELKSIGGDINFDIKLDLPKFKWWKEKVE
jgi:hypothetical protein